MNNIEKFSPLLLQSKEYSSIIYKYDLLKSSTSFEEIYEKVYRLFHKSILENSILEAEKTEQYLRKFNFNYITFYDEIYPFLLKQISDPPIILFYKGNINILEYSYIGVVGTRKPSSFALSATSSFIDIVSQRARCGIVSGLANGIDREAMLRAIQKNIPLIGVMGTSFDNEYPSTNKDLYQLMKQRENSLIITELRPLEKIGKWSFPKRNRIITGLSESIVIMEAPLDSGAMSSATHAISQNRDILVFDDESLKYNSGGRKLIEEGAKRITKNDLINHSQMVHISDILPDSPESLSNSIAILSKMELEGKVREVGGGYFEFFK